jgi:hypothetical protein
MFLVHHLLARLVHIIGVPAAQHAGLAYIFESQLPITLSI